jgi:hypothetical protein
VTGPTPAGWAPVTDLFGEQWDALPPEVADASLEQAVRLLWALTGRQLGTRPIRLAPYVPWPRSDYFTGLTRRGYGYAPLGWASPASVTVGFGCAGFAGFVAFRLPGRPVTVEQVWIDGAALDPGSWTLDPDGTLVRTDGGTWRYAQNVYAPAWIVGYTEGAVVDAAGNAAAGRLALEIGRALLADPACRLNPRTRDLVRGGTSISLADPNEPANAGLTGVVAVDRWVRAVNPGGLSELASLSGMNTARHRVLS